MNAKKCDRCGGFYIPTSPTLNLEKAVEALKNGKPKHITDVCDLCPNCVKDFYDWMRGANRNE